MKKLKSGVIICVLVLQSLDGSGQSSLVLRPYWGHKWFGINENNIRANNFDATYNTNVKSQGYQTAIALEYLKKNRSWELFYSSQPGLAKFTTSFKDIIDFSQWKGIGNGGVKQLQFLYNYYLPKKWIINSKYHIAFKLGAGIGIGVNPPWYYKPLFFSDYDFFSNPAGDSVVVNISSQRKSRFIYNGVFRICFTYRRNLRERFSVNAVFNWVPFDYQIHHYNYKHNTTEYGGSVSDKTNYYGFQLSVPVTLKRWKKK